MGKKFLFDVSPTGVEHYAEIDHDGDQLTLIEHTPSRIESTILDECARTRSLAQSRGRQFQLAAKVPINTYVAWKKEWREQWSQIYSWPTFEAIKLNNRDHCNLRVGQQRSAFGKKL